MTRLPRTIRALTLALATFGLPAGWAAAQAEPPIPPPGVPADPSVPPPSGEPVPPPAGSGSMPFPGIDPNNPRNDPLYLQIDNTLHYLNIASFKLAIPELQALAEMPGDLKFLQTLEKVFADRGLEVEPTLYRFRENEELKPAIDALLKKIDEVQTTVVRSEPVMTENITKLASGNQRERTVAFRRLRQAGDVAIPLMVDRLLNPDTKDAEQGAILVALRELRGTAVAPLMAASLSKNEDLLQHLTGVLLDMQYTEAVPYVVRIAEDPATSPSLKRQVTMELARHGVQLKQVKAGDLFYQLAERFYYNNSGIRPDPRDNGKGRVWFWKESDDKSQRGHLSFKDVPADAFADVQAMRAAELALANNASGDAVSLWLAANNKREVHIKEGEDPGMYADAPAALYNVRMGSQHLNQVLIRAMRDGGSQGLVNPAQRPVFTRVALKAIKSLSEIVGQNSIAGSPLIDAMHYPDRVVRYEAAIALAGGLPQKPFGGQERVVLLLAEALAQTGTPGVLIFAKDEADLQAQKAALGDKFRVAGGATAVEVIGQSAMLPSVDVILFSEDADPAELQKLLAAANGSSRLDYSARVVMINGPQSPWVSAAATDPRVTATSAKAAAPEALQQAIADARTKAGGIPLDEAAATQYALRAADALRKLGISRGQVLNILPTEPTLLASLSDPRAELAKSAAGVVALLDSDKTQPALCDQGVNEKTPDDVKVACYKALASSAKFFGNRLDAKRVEDLRKAAASERTLEAKIAAAEALGALNLQSEAVKPLILNRASETGAAPMAP